MNGIDKREARHRNLGWNERRLLWIQDSRVSVHAVRNRRQFVAKPVVQCELGVDLPVIQNKEPIAPFRYNTFELLDRRHIILCGPKHKVRRRISAP